MSHRELRNFTEMTRALGYPRLISLENFRRPNFPLVAEMLLWLVKRFDPSVDIPLEIDTDQDRVIFIKSVCQIMVAKAHVKLNARKLYMADGYAVKEMLKVTHILYKAMLTNSGQNGSSHDVVNPNTVPGFDSTSKLSDLKRIRQLASEITQYGAVLYDCLAEEVDLKELRNSALTRQLEIGEVEKCLLDAIEAVKEETKKLHSAMETVAADEANLEAKVEKKKLELERNQNRLLTLKSVRPAFMDEFERLEEELSEVHRQYVLKFRCLAYLEAQLEEVERSESKAAQEREQQIRKLVSKLQQEEDAKPLMEGNPEALGPQNETSGRLVFGSMMGDKALDSDSDLDLQGEEDDPEDSSDDDLDLEDFSELRGVRPPGRRQLTVVADSDNDF